MDILKIESKIQKCIRHNFKIGYYKQHSQFSWLGKQEITDEKELKSICLKFNNSPDVDCETIKLFKDKFGYKSEDCNE